MNDLPDLRSFPMKGGVDYGKKELDRAELYHENGIDEARSKALRDAQDRARKAEGE